MKKRSNKKKKRTSKKSFDLKYVVYFLILIIFTLSSFIVGILLTQTNCKKEIKKSTDTIKILERKIKALQKKTVSIPQKQTYPQHSEITDYKYAHNTTRILPSPVIAKRNLHKKIPELVIIIDDVSFRYQINGIKKIPYKITPSFFPPTKIHPDTVIYAKEFSHYMIHLPLEAIHFDRPEPNTLDINASYTKILNRIKQVKKDFPRAKFLNNHTGSTFTANTPAMLKLFKALKAEHLGFVDSKTTPYSKSEIADKIYHIPLFSRDIFLDNKENTEYIRNQLKKAVEIAKRRGYAIAIGHPHPVTLETLKNAKDILKNVKVVYIDKLMKNEYAKQ